MTGAERRRLLVNRGRVAARIAVVWCAVTGALFGLDALLPGFAMSEWWQPIVCAMMLGLLTGVLWPLVLRLAMPVVVFTLGLGTYLLIAAGTLATFKAVPGVEIANFHSALAVTLGMTVVGAVMSSLLAIDPDEIFYRRVARRTTAQALAEEPAGVIFLQIDGLAHDVVQRAVRDGDMPTLASWLAEDSHSLAMWHTDWSSQTGASVCAILHGSNHDILGFRWYEKDRDHVMACAHPRDAAEIERRHSTGKGLLAADGASRGNLFSGDAPHVSLTMSAVSMLVPKQLRKRRRDRVGTGYFAYFTSPMNLMRTIVAAIADVARELLASARQRRANVRPRVNRGGLYPLARPGTTVIARDVVVSAIIEDILAGRPVVYADFLGYDEVAHHSGIERFDSLAVLRDIDLRIGRLHRAAQLGPRPYHLVVLSDHGQTQGWAFAARFGEPIEQLVGRLSCVDGEADGCGAHDPRRITEGWQLRATLAEATAGGGPIARRLRARVDRAGTAPHRIRTEDGAPGDVARVAPGVVVVVSGHLAMVSFTEHEGRVPLETIEREFPRLLPELVDHDGVGFMLVHSLEFGPVVLGRDGLRRLRTGVVIGEDPLTNYGPHAADLVKRVSEFPHCADIMINSRYDPETGNASPFEPHVGSHGGLGGEQNRGFLMYPKEFPATGEVVGAESLHRVLRGWLTHLGHELPDDSDAADTPAMAG